MLAQSRFCAHEHTTPFAALFTCHVHHGAFGMSRRDQVAFHCVVRPKVDGTGGHNTSQHGANATPKTKRAIVARDLQHDVGDAAARNILRLQMSLHHLQRTRDKRPHHTAAPPRCKMPPLPPPLCGSSLACARARAVLRRANLLRGFGRRRLAAMTKAPRHEISSGGDER